MTVHSTGSLCIVRELMSLLQASLMHCEVLHRTCPIFFPLIKEDLTGSSANAKTTGKHHLAEELSELSKAREDRGEIET